MGTGAQSAPTRHFFDSLRGHLKTGVLGFCPLRCAVLFDPSTPEIKKCPWPGYGQGRFFMPVVGVEPTRCHHQRILSPSRLPIPTHRHRKLFYYSGSFAKSQDASWAIAAFFAGTVVFCGPGVYNLSCIILFKM